MSIEMLLSKNKKDEIQDLLLKHSEAYSNASAAEQRGGVPAEEIGALKTKTTEALNKVIDVVRNWNLAQVKEIANHIQFATFNDSVIVLGKGKSQWDGKTASRLANTLRSLQNAFVTKTREEAKSDPRYRELSKRASFTALIVEALSVREFNSELILSSGISYESVQFLLRRIDAVVEKEIEVDARSQRAQYLNNLYGRIEKASGWLKPTKSEPRTGTFRMNEVIHPKEQASA